MADISHDLVELESSREDRHYWLTIIIEANVKLSVISAKKELQGRCTKADLEELKLELILWEDRSPLGK